MSPIQTGCPIHSLENVDSIFIQSSLLNIELHNKIKEKRALLYPLHPIKYRFTCVLFRIQFQLHK